MRYAIALALGAVLLAAPTMAAGREWLGSGMWRIGGQHPPGVYIAPKWAKTPNTYCYYEVRTKPFGSGVENVLDNDYVEGKVTQYAHVEATLWLYIEGNRGCRFFLR